MPNKRDPDLVRVDLWMPSTMRRRLGVLAEVRGLSLMETIRQAIDAACEDAKLEEIGDNESKEEVAAEGRV